MFRVVRLNFLFFSLVAFLSACSSSSFHSEGHNAVFDYATLSNLPYLGVLNEGSVVRLKDGFWKGPAYEASSSAPGVELLQDFIIRGDLFGDAGEEAVVLLLSWAGGSGMFTTAAVVGEKEGVPVHVGGVLLGDRVQVLSAIITDKELHIDMLEPGPNDPACCVTQRSKKVFRWMRNEMVLVPELTQSQKTTLDILGESVWQLSRMHSGEIVPVDIQITLRYAEGRLTGRSACNQYFAGVKQGEKFGDVIVDMPGSTRMMCQPEVMKWEDEYQPILPKISRFWFKGGLLYVNYVLPPDSLGGVRLGTLIFKKID